MSLKARLQRYFSKPESTNRIGLSIKQQHLDVSVVDSSCVAKTHQLALLDNRLENTFASLKELKISGECCIVLPAKQSQIVQVEKPNVPDEELTAALKWQIKDLVPVAPEEMIVDYYDMPGGNGGTARVNVVCAAKEDLSRLVALSHQYGYQISRLTIEEFAFAQLIPVQEEASLLLCQQPGEEMLIIVVKQGRLYFQRRLRGMANIAQRSEEELALGAIDSLSLEIQRSIDYFERQLKQAPIKSIQVLVPMKNEGYLARKLAENAAAEVQIFNMPDGYHEHREFAAAIGASLIKPKEVSR